MNARRLLAVFCLCLAWTQPAAAQDAASTDKRADIERLLELTQAQIIAQQMSEAMVTQLTNVVRSSNPDIPQNVLDALPGAVNSVIEENMPSLMDEMVGIYDRHFTHADIEGFIEFYETDLGRKFIDAQPQINRESMAVGQQWGQSLGPAVQQRVQERLAEEGFDL